jgi:hypothetical protein
MSVYGVELYIITSASSKRLTNSIINTIIGESYQTFVKKKNAQNFPEKFSLKKNTHRFFLKSSPLLKKMHGIFPNFVFLFFYFIDIFLFFYHKRLYK